MFDWHDIPKIDAHVNIATPEMYDCYQSNPGNQSWRYADVDKLLSLMDRYHVEKLRGGADCVR